MEEQVQMNEKLRALLEKAKREKKIASKDLIDTLEAIDADEKQTELIYEALDEAGVEIDVSDVVELLSKPEEMLPSEEDLELIEEEKIIDTEDLSENMSRCACTSRRSARSPCSRWRRSTSSPCAWPRAMKRPRKK